MREAQIGWNFTLYAMQFRFKMNNSSCLTIQWDIWTLSYARCELLNNFEEPIPIMILQNYKSQIGNKSQINRASDFSWQVLLAILTEGSALIMFPCSLTRWNRPTIRRSQAESRLGPTGFLPCCFTNADLSNLRESDKKKWLRLTRFSFLHA